MIVHEGGVLEAKLAIHGSHAIPSEIKSLLKSGKLSTKAMPGGRFNELHQDYVCSCALRIGRELLAILPDELVIVTAMDNVLNSSTGHMEDQPILSVTEFVESVSYVAYEHIGHSTTFNIICIMRTFTYSTRATPKLHCSTHDPL